MEIDYNELMKGADSCVELMGVKEKVRVLIITDKPTIAEALAKASKNHKGDVIVLYLPNSIRPITQLSEAMRSAILESDVVFTPFEAIEEEWSFFRKKILDLVNENVNLRIAHMPSVTPEMFKPKGMLSLTEKQHQDMKDLTRNLAILLSATDFIKIESPFHQGSLELYLERWSRSGVVSTGDIMNGSWGNLPSGEAFVVPKSAHGKITIDKAITGIPLADLPITMEVTNGIIELDTIEGEGGESLKDCLKKYSGSDAIAARTVCEFGIGTNPKTSTLAPIEIEKMMRTIHIGIGNNSILGGSIKAEVPHIDMVVDHPTVTVHDLHSKEIKIMESGKILKDRIDTFLRIDYKSFSNEFSGTTVRIKDGFESEVIDDKLYRCWKDHRGTKLHIAVGNDDTAKKVRTVWERISTNGEWTVRYNDFRDSSEIINQLLNTLEIFGMIERFSPLQPYLKA